MSAVPQKISEIINKTVKNIDIIECSENKIIWKVSETKNKVTLTMNPLCLKFSEYEQLKGCIESHFNKIHEKSKGYINSAACKDLKDCILKGEISGGEENKTKHNDMSLLHFFGTWLGPTNDNRNEGHAIMNNLHYELFGFHFYNGVNCDELIHGNCKDKCIFKTCLKFAKNGGNDVHQWYNNPDEVFSNYKEYLIHFLNEYPDLVKYESSSTIIR